MSQARSGSSSPTFLAFVPDEESLVVLQAFAESQGWNAQCIRQGNADDAASYLADHPTPDFLLVDVPSADDAPDALDALADVCDPNVKVLVTSTVDEFSFFRWLTDIGVHHYLLKPLTEEALERAILLPAAGEANAEKAEKKGQLVAVIGTRGGVGASTVALNLAATFADIHHQPTALLDLEAHWGTQSLMLDLEPARGLRDALTKPDRIDSLFMERVLLKHSDYLSVLSSEEPLDTDIAIHPDAADALLEETRKKFPMVVADVPRDGGKFTSDILRAADHVVIVCELTLFSLRDAMRLNDYLKDKLKLKSLHFVANRTGMLSKYEMPRTEFEKSLGQKFYGVVPFDIEAYGKMASGEVAVNAKAPSPMAKALIDIAGQLHKPLKSAAGSKKKGLMGWLAGKK